MQQLFQNGAQVDCILPAVTKSMLSFDTRPQFTDLDMLQLCCEIGVEDKATLQLCIYYTQTVLDRAEAVMDVLKKCTLKTSLQQTD